MLVPDALADELCSLSSQYCKPKISIENYVLEWNADSAGIPRSAETSLRTFIRELASHISTSIFEASNEFHRNISNNVKNDRNGRRLEESLNPCILMSKRFGTGAYFAIMHRDGRTNISMMQRPTAASKSRTTPAATLPSFFSELGELVFYREPGRL